MSDPYLQFKGSMIRGLLEDRKTQTRRLLKPQPYSTQSVVSYDERSGKWMSCEPSPATGGTRQMDPWRQINIKTGDRVWVRETWGSLEADHTSASGAPGYRKPQPGDRIVYHADPASAAQWGPGLPSQGSFMWRPSIHMPRWASRITLVIEDVKVERLQDISEEDAIAEGVVQGKTSFEYDIGTVEKDWFTVPGFDDPGTGISAVDMYSQLWEHINGAGSWAANPWVFAVSFRVVPRNIEEAF